MDHNDVLEILRTEVATFGTQKEFAMRARVSPQFLSDVLKGRRNVTGKLLDFLNIEEVVTYERHVI